MVGRRTFAVTYVVQQPVDAHLPPIEVRWWNLDTGTAATARVPGIDVHAVAAAQPPAPFEIPAAQPVSRAAKPVPWHLMLAVLIPSMAAVLLIRWLAPVGRRAIKRLEDRLAARRQRYLDSERHSFSELCSALHGSDTSAIIRALYRWLDRLPRSRFLQAPTVREIDSLTALTRWLDARYAGQTPAPTSELIDELRAARRRILGRTPGSRDEHRLPALNP